MKIAFFINPNLGWTGGVNYYKNLFHFALQHNPELEIFIFGHDLEAIKSLGYPVSVKLIKTNVSKRFSFEWIVNKFSRMLFGREFVIEQLCKKFDIQVVSHSNVTNLGSIKTANWIPDFQHFEHPEMFSKDEIIRRDRAYKNLLINSDLLFLSSESALEVAKKFCPNLKKDKVRVLRFSVNMPVSYDESKVGEIKQITTDKKIIYFPGQVWKHKNHELVIKALALLPKELLSKIILISTGNTEDYRNPEFFKNLLDLISKHQLTSCFIFRGLVDINEQIFLYQKSDLVINPSLYEGWSTTVEEGKFYNRPIALSNIPVHLEQAPSGALYFNPKHSEELARIIQQEKYPTLGSNRYSEKQKEFGRKYTGYLTEIL